MIVVVTSNMTMDALFLPRDRLFLSPRSLKIGHENWSVIKKIPLPKLQTFYLLPDLFGLWIYGILHTLPPNVQSSHQHQRPIPEGTPFSGGGGATPSRGSDSDAGRERDQRVATGEAEIREWRQGGRTRSECDSGKRIISDSDTGGKTR